MVARGADWCRVGEDLGFPSQIQPVLAGERGAVDRWLRRAVVVGAGGAAAASFDLPSFRQRCGRSDLVFGRRVVARLGRVGAPDV